MSHATAELLSAYFDDVLDDEVSDALEAHLETCPDCRSRLGGLRSAVAGLKRLERMAPPPSLDQAVARRVAMAAERRGFAARLESGLDTYSRQTSTLVLFAVVLALAVMAYLLAGAVERGRRGSIDVVFSDDPIPGTVVEVGPRALVRSATGWVERGIEPGTIPARTVAVGSPEWVDVVALNPDLAPVAELVPALVQVDGEVVAVVAPSPPG